MQFDRLITITVGNNRKSVNWRPQTIMLSDFYEKLRVPARSTETMQAYESDELNFRLIDSRGFEYSFFNTKKSVKDMKTWMKKGLKDESPRIHISDEGACAKLDFIDGRHRYSVLRDMGMTQMPFILDKASYEAAKTYGLLT